MARQVHDIGGSLAATLDDAPIAPSKADDHWELWEQSTHALNGILVRKGYYSLDELRRAIEALPDYESMSYYRKWASGIAQIAVEKGVLTRREIEEALGEEIKDESKTFFKAGDIVRVKEESINKIRWRKPHLRTPGYIFGLIGVVERFVALYSQPEVASYAYFDHPAPRIEGASAALSIRQPLYRVRFRQTDVWEMYSGGAEDTVDVEIFQPWLSLSSQEDLEAQGRARSPHNHIHEHGHSLSHEHDGHSHSHEHDGHSHSHDHDGHSHSHEHDGHSHSHEERHIVEQQAIEKEGEASLSSESILSEALFKIFDLKGIATREEVMRGVEALDNLTKGTAGARLVAKSWIDPSFRARLLQDGNAAAAELGINASNFPRKEGPLPATCSPRDRYGTLLVAVENTAEVHNLVVCTLCSCYPVAILGLSPSWYRNRSYRSRSVRDPRGVLKEFGLSLPPDVSVRVHDSTADCRYLVIPQRPHGTEGWSEEDLVKIVTRDSMIGVAVLK